MSNITIFNTINSLKTRLSKLPLKKARNWIRWYSKTHKHDINLCAYGKEHLVGKVTNVGGGYTFKSKACSGCDVGKVIISKKLNLPISVVCAFLLEQELLVHQNVKEGEVIYLPDLR